MQCMDEGTWLARGLVFEEVGRLKFDVSGDWQENYGDNRPPNGSIMGWSIDPGYRQCKV